MQFRPADRIGRLDGLLTELRKHPDGGQAGTRSSGR